MVPPADAIFEFDPFSPEVVADPDSYFRELRDGHPVYYSEKYDTFFVSRFQDVWDVLRLGDNTLLGTETALPTAEYLQAHRNDGPPPLASVDPLAPGPTLHSPHYEEMRSLHVPPLKPRSVAALAGFVRELARLQLEEVMPQRQFDLATEYAAVIPAKLICWLFGLPISVTDEVRRKLGEMGRYREGRRGVDLSAFFSELERYIVPAVRARRMAGADGSNRLIDGLVRHRTRADRRALTDQEISNQLVCTMVGGLESVPKVTARGIMELWRRPDQLEEVRADLERNVPIAVEEMVRYCAPAQYTFRTAHKDLTVAGREVKAGQRVACLLYSASRDDREFEHPDEFVWNRPIRRVLSFGLGQHHCIGKHLGLLEVRTLVREFLSRVESAEFLVDEAERNVGYFQRGLLSLPVRVTARTSL